MLLKISATEFFVLVFVSAAIVVFSGFVVWLQLTPKSHERTHAFYVITWQPPLKKISYNFGEFIAGFLLDLDVYVRQYYCILKWILSFNHNRTRHIIKSRHLLALTVVTTFSLIWEVINLELWSLKQ